MRLASLRLAPGGLVAARAPLGEGDRLLPEALRRALRHMPRASVWRVVHGEALILASRSPPNGARSLDRAFSRPGPAGWLRPLGLSYPATLLSLQAVGDRTTRRLAWGPGAAAPSLVAEDDRATGARRRALLLDGYLRGRGAPLKPREYLEILLHPRSPEEQPVFRELLEEWVSRYPRDPRALAFLYVVEEREGHSRRASVLRSRLSALRRRKPAIGRQVVVPGK
jgi:hypothetical protein